MDPFLEKVDVMIIFELVTETQMEYKKREIWQKMILYQFSQAKLDRIAKVYIGKNGNISVVEV